MTRRQALFLSLGGLPLRASARTIRLPLRSRVEAFKGSGHWREVRVDQDFDLGRTALLICDMWNQHWCRGATERVEILTRTMEPFLQAARAAGVVIIHSPSDVMDFYKDTPQRRRAIEAPAAQPERSLQLPDPPLPIDDSGGGCDTGESSRKAWSRQHPALAIAPVDYITDRGSEVYNVLRQRGVENLLVMGVHTNMCVLNRSFAIKQMIKWGVRCVLVRDLTDAMYSPKDYPYVSHEQGTNLVIEHIEKHWCPTVTSAEVLGALKGRSNS
ncbi:MAG: isochorismatase [Bryobacteraceae bacterium]